VRLAVSGYALHASEESSMGQGNTYFLSSSFNTIEEDIVKFSIFSALRVLVVVGLLLPTCLVNAVRADDVPDRRNKDWLKKSLSFVALSAEKEKALFLKLPTVSLESLEPGDILLKKDYGDYAKTSPVVTGQKLYNGKRGSKYTSHAMLSIGDGKVAEAIADKPSGAWKRGLAAHYGPSESYPKGAYILAYRPLRGGDAAERAVACANLLASDGWESGGTMTADIGYSMENCLGSWVGSSKYGPKAREHIQTLSAGKAPFSSMMCSEFVSFCYQFKEPDLENPRLKLDAHRTAPVRLEDFLNGSDGFELLGRLKW
jgi:hypothetical protein